MELKEALPKFLDIFKVFVESTGDDYQYNEEVANTIVDWLHTNKELPSDNKGIVFTQGVLIPLYETTQKISGVLSFDNYLEQSKNPDYWAKMVYLLHLIRIMKFKTNMKGCVKYKWKLDDDELQCNSTIDKVML